MAFKVGTEYQEIADKLVEKFPVGFGHIDTTQILFLIEDEKKSKAYADVKLVKGPFSFITAYKFIITVYDKTIAHLNEAQKVMLIYHELMHIDETFTKLKKHDIEDFRILLSKYGINWDIDPNLPNILDDDVEGEE